MTEQEMIKKIFQTENIYVIFCNFSRMPYIECDPEDFSDKTFFFFEEEKAKKFCESRKEKKMSLAAVVLPQNALKSFFSALLTDGIDTVCIEDGDIINLPINKIITRTLREGVGKPIENPALQLSIMYFLQAVRVAETDEEKEESRRLEEEMMVNIARSIYLVPFTKLDETDENGNQKINLMNLKNKNDEVFIPLFTDLDEFNKIRPAEKQSAFLPMGFKQIRNTKLNGLNGFVINPGSSNIQLTEQNIAAVDRKFGDQAR